MAVARTEWLALVDGGDHDEDFEWLRFARLRSTAIDGGMPWRRGERKRKTTMVTMVAPRGMRSAHEVQRWSMSSGGGDRRREDDGE
ncbi:hypothetical protein E2562_024084 [Oryza meyeriana var. granulata]|uniref:DUF834 domain-containing protein n=1 Tax=Oryza meyeriana var. granulata TaxID=110450 RepID=A0A6G1CI73_9ORYZ|nr:hypothetical protein E2562_024084 [Oryza meyeriana var. granulata]